MNIASENDQFVIDLPIINGDFPLLCKRLSEGTLLAQQELLVTSNYLFLFESQLVETTLRDAGCITKYLSFFSVFLMHIHDHFTFDAWLHVSRCTPKRYRSYNKSRHFLLRLPVEVVIQIWPLVLPILLSYDGYDQQPNELWTTQALLRK